VLKIAIMQPYIFPYIGYFQLIHAVDKFIILDDVNFINKGWINRNKILVNQVDYTFTIPLQKASQNKLILETEISEEQKWKIKFLKTIEISYNKAPLFQKVFPIVNDIINLNEKNISTFIYQHFRILKNYIKFETEIIQSSSKYHNGHLKAQDKILDICIQENADFYINPIGGTELYTNKNFKELNIDLFFIKSNQITYKQYENQFVPWLSIIDVLMFNPVEKISEFLNQFTLIKNE